jgi:hypothetical protein
MIFGGKPPSQENTVKTGASMIKATQLRRTTNAVYRVKRLRNLIEAISDDASD